MPYSSAHPLRRGLQACHRIVDAHLAVLVTATIFSAATGIVCSSVTLLGVMARRR
jgi:TRAP-type mannitol/chloroaromatic compound transport system permease large subunit